MAAPQAISPTSNGQHHTTYLSVNAVAKRFNLCRNTVRTYCNEPPERPRFKSYRTPGQHRRICVKSVELALGLVSTEEHKKETGKRVAVYVRVSSQQQRAEGGLKRQKEKLIAWAQEK